MTRQKSKWVGLTLATIPLALTAAVGMARPVKKARPAFVLACRDEIQRLCQRDETGGPRKLARCLQQSPSELEPRCTAALRHAKRIARFRHLCANDVKALC